MKKYHSHQLVGVSRGNVITIGTAVLIVLVTLFPFDFTWQVGISLGNIFQQFHHPSNVADFLGNILLFMPLGFGMTSWLREQRIPRVTAGIIVVFLSFSLSLTVEILQVFLPSRSPTDSDLVANSLGGFAGYSVFQVWRATILGYSATFLDRVDRSLSVPRLVTLLITYIAIALLFLMPHSHATRLSNWDTSFPLIIGNERTGDRPWNGEIAQVWVSDRALSQREVQQAFSHPHFIKKLGNARLAEYQLSGEGNYRDHAGNLPDLIWKGEGIKSDQSHVAFFNSQKWLETPTPVTVLSQRLRQSSQFSLGVTLAPSRLNQSGPARIISISDNPFQRNLTVGQEFDHLILRLRTPKTGNNGITPAIALPNAFHDTDWHRIIITYDAPKLAFYIDQVDNLKTINLNLHIPFFGKLSFLWHEQKLYLYPALLEIYKFLSYGIIFIPCAIILTLLTRKLKH